MDSGYLATQVTTIIGQLHGLFDDIGVPSHERESREAKLFAALSETLNDQVRTVTAEKDGLTEEAYRIIKTIRQMEASLEDGKSVDDLPLEDRELKVFVPLSRCIKGLKEKHNAIASIHRERFEQIKKLCVALESYSSHLEPSFLKVKLPPTSQNASIPPTFDLSPSYVASLDDEFTRVYEEYGRRLESVKSISEGIVELWAELGTPQAQTDSTIVRHYRDAPEQLGLHMNDISRLQTKHDKLAQEKKNREQRLKELKTIVEGLWERLGVEDMDRKRFLAGTRGCGLRIINEFEAELDRLKELKRQNLHLFVEDARYKLQELWDALYLSEEEMLEFTPAFSDVYSDALLSAHEDEIARLEALKEQRLPALQLIEKHRSLIKDREDLAASSQDVSRLMLKGQKGEKRDPGKLLREEKMRKRITKELPKVETDLRRALERWEDDYGRPFMVHGQSYLEELENAATTKAAPPRSKTPSGPPPTARPSKSASVSSHSRANSVIRGVPPRAKSPAGFSSVRGNPFSQSVMSSASRTSPTKIPGRIPLSTMKHGNNSPERRGSKDEPSYDSNTIRKMAPPTRAPPPKMRDLFIPPTVANAPDSGTWRSDSTTSSHSGPVRHVSPEDVYSDQAYAPSAYEERSPPQAYDTLPQQYVGRADSRQVSATSSTSQAVSGSENWETYDDASASDTEQDEDAYYAGLRATKGKRGTPDDGYTPPRPVQGKKLRSAYQDLTKRSYAEESGPAVVIPAGSDAGWTDEDTF